ncbi:MAG: CHAT domain-containing protein [Candidatus Omnitrophica bacterium]|nr:CHAT domain-containing protein [Candidatus Omnitrophota bacterium]
MPQDAHALILDLFHHSEHLKMCIFEQREAVPTVRHYNQCQVKFPEIERLSGEITSILNKANKKGFLEEDYLNALKKSGQILWDLLLSRAVKEKLRSSAQKALVLSLDEELIHIPWELLFDGSNFLCLRFNLGRIVRSKENSGNPRYRELSLPLKMLVLANPTNDLSGAYLEGLNIKNQFDKKRDKIKIDFKSTHIDTLYVKKNLRDYDLVHYAGHSEYDMDEPLNSGWLLDNGKFGSDDIKKMSETLFLPSLVFSNGCHTAENGDRAVGHEYQRQTYNLAQTFLFSGVRHYIGTIRKIEDGVSSIFANEFYSHLIKGQSVGESLRLSRFRLMQEYGVSSIFWASYLLYGDPDFKLFSQPEKKESVRRRSFSFKKILLLSASALVFAMMLAFFYSRLPSKNPDTYFLFMKTGDLLRSGANQEVVDLSLRMIGKDPQFLAAYPRLAEAFKRQGKREEALKYYFEYSIASQKKNDFKKLADAYIGIGWTYQELGQYGKAFDFYSKALKLSKERNDFLNEAVALRKLAVWYMDKNDDDKALELLTKSSEINLERRHIYEHKYNLACDYFDLGLLFTNKDDYPAANKFYSKSLSLFNGMHLNNELSDYYFNLGEIFLFEKSYQKAIESYLHGLEIDRKQDNLPSIASDYNMLGELYLDMDNMEKAEEAFRKSESLCKRIGARPELASVNFNLGLLFKKKNKKSAAREYFRLAEEFYRQIGSPEYEDAKKELLELDN